MNVNKAFLSETLDCAAMNREFDDEDDNDNIYARGKCMAMCNEASGHIAYTWQKTPHCCPSDQQISKRLLDLNGGDDTFLFVLNTKTETN